MSNDSPSLIFKKSRLVKNIIRELRHHLYMFLAQYPDFYISYSHWRDSFSARGDYGGRLLERDTDIIIDGFPRSANSFAVSAFKLAQNDYVKVANHRHDPAQIIAAVKKNIPTLVLIREPKYATTSLILHNYSFDYAYASIKRMLRGYCRYYAPLLPYRDRIVVAHFETVTSDMRGIISTVNDKFGTGFEEFVHTQENVEQCFNRIEERAMKFKREKKIQSVETSVSRPSQHRNELKKKLLRDFSRPENKALYSQAYKIYERFNSVAI
ncbi:hypothetical protein PCC7418_1878 [Halothece sp. PCC 7418]|uniref:hypothetical protein n=1 Tax=Halothece sp. (strain PCC 7418) TaxID=65093 RepID=UPI0002A07B8E|nr:hypothetical protein [Halothece sp. PCC 7418]AFZ44046.1 hypothetical protein PCC7418_1878 [Halothece sp. PCC 7418]